MKTLTGDAEGAVVFVYGTLRAVAGGEMHLRLSSCAMDVFPAECRGRLYDAGRYPAAVPSSSGQDRIRGEAYLLPADSVLVLEELDLYEGASGAASALFRRELTDVRLQDGRWVRAWIYWYARPVEGLRRLGGEGNTAEWMPCSAPARSVRQA